MKEFFQDRATRFFRLENEFRKKGKTISNIRWALFVIFLGLLVYLFSSAFYLYAFLLTLIFVSAYVPLVIRHRKLNFQAEYNKALGSINNDEIRRIDGKIENLHPGKEFYDVGHSYTKDLDIFGNYSLFQYINRCASEDGMERLAHWLKQPADQKEIWERQEAVKELSDYLDFRQNLQAEGKMLSISRKQAAHFSKWSESQTTIFSRSWFRPAVLSLNLLSLLTMLYCLFYGNWKLFLIPAVFNAIFLNIARHALKDIKETTEEITGSLKTLSRIFQLLENQEVKSEKLKQLKSPLLDGGNRASGKIRKLAQLYEMLEYTSNPYFYIVANFTFLWDLHRARQIEKYRIQTGRGPVLWLASLYEYEALSSLAGLAFLKKEWSYPVLAEGKLIYEASALAHPLIFRGEAVANDFSFEGTSGTFIITGSNMSGKSTFLRTLGINAVLAFAGAPVCAASLKISPFSIFTSMRTEDNLQESTSSFYAELKRLKQLLESLNEQIPVFYLLDEILKGTNSADRNTGGKALVRQLQGKNAAGLIATHDIELSNLEAEAPGKIFNYNFSSEVIDGRLYFDYKLKKGVCRSFNATELMRQIGIEVDLGMA